MEALGGEAARRACALLAVLAAVLATGKPALAKTHVVGGKEGWDANADLNTWASSNTFRVDDELVFEYTAQLHNVVELPDDKRYKKCDTTGLPVDMSGGKNTVKLDKPGTRYFACGHPDHCEQGEKVKIKTLAHNEVATPSSEGGTPSSSSSAPSSKDKPSSSTAPSSKEQPSSSTAASKEKPSSATATASPKSSSRSLMGSCSHAPLVAMAVVLSSTVLGLVVL